MCGSASRLIEALAQRLGNRYGLAAVQEQVPAPLMQMRSNGRSYPSGCPGYQGRGRIKQVDVSFDGGINWQTARIEGPVQNKALTRFNIGWVWDGKPAILQSRAIDETGYVQPTYGQLRKVRGTKSIYHNNAIQSWKVVESGEVTNVQVL